MDRADAPQPPGQSPATAQRPIGPTGDRPAGERPTHAGQSNALGRDRRPGLDRRRAPDPRTFERHVHDQAQAHLDRRAGGRGPRLGRSDRGRSTRRRPQTRHRNQGPGAGLEAIKDAGGRLEPAAAGRGPGDRRRPRRQAHRRREGLGLGPEPVPESTSGPDGRFRLCGCPIPIRPLARNSQSTPPVDRLGPRLRPRDGSRHRLFTRLDPAN